MQAGARAYRQASAQALREKLILDHLPLVRHIVGRLLVRLPAGTDEENLEAAGVLGLVEAANRFDPERGAKFETYAATRIRGAMLDELRRNCPMPQQMLERAAKVRRAYQQLPPGASVEALAEAAGLALDDVADCLAALRLTRAASGPDDLLSNQPGRPDEQPDVRAELAEQRRLLAKAIEALPERERLVLTLYYSEDLRLKEIGQLLELSESRVCRLLNMALYNLGEYLRK